MLQYHAMAIGVRLTSPSQVRNAYASQFDIASSNSCNCQADRHMTPTGLVTVSRGTIVRVPSSPPTSRSPMLQVEPPVPTQCPYRTTRIAGRCTRYESTPSKTEHVYATHLAMSENKIHMRSVHKADKGRPKLLGRGDRPHPWHVHHRCVVKAAV